MADEDRRSESFIAKARQSLKEYLFSDESASDHLDNNSVDRVDGLDADSLCSSPPLPRGSLSAETDNVDDSTVFFWSKVEFSTHPGVQGKMQERCVEIQPPSLASELFGDASVFYDLKPFEVMRELHRRGYELRTSTQVNPFMSFPPGSGQYEVQGGYGGFLFNPLIQHVLVKRQHDEQQQAHKMVGSENKTAIIDNDVSHLVKVLTLEGEVSRLHKRQLEMDSQQQKVFALEGEIRKLQREREHQRNLDQAEISRKVELKMQTLEEEIRQHRLSNLRKDDDIAAAERVQITMQKEFEKRIEGLEERLLCLAKRDLAGIQENSHPARRSVSENQVINDHILPMR